MGSNRKLLCEHTETIQPHVASLSFFFSFSNYDLRISFGASFKPAGKFASVDAREKLSALPLPIDGESQANILNRCALYSNSAR